MTSKIVLILTFIVVCFWLLTSQPVQAFTEQKKTVKKVFEDKKYVYVLKDESPEYRRYLGMDIGSVFVGRTIIPNSPIKPVDMSLPPPYEAGVSGKQPYYRSRQSSEFIHLYHGYKLLEHFRFESGIFLNIPDKTNDGYNSVHGLHLSCSLSIPIVYGFEFMPGIGGCYYNFRSDFRSKSFPGISYKERGIIPRILLGLEYRINERYAFRVSSIFHRRSGIDFENESMHNMIKIGAGLNYSF